MFVHFEETPNLSKFLYVSGLWLVYAAETTVTNGA